MPMNQTVQGLRFETTAPAAEVAVANGKARGYATDVDFEMIYGGRYYGILNTTTECLRMLDVEKANALLGPMFTAGAKVASPVSTCYNVPNVLWGPTPLSAFDDANAYPLTTAIVPDAFTSSLALIEVCKVFGWKDIAFVYTTSNTDLSCTSLTSELEAAVSVSPHAITLTLKARMNLQYKIQTANLLEEIKKRTRVVFTCFNDGSDQRDFMIALYDNGMATSEYVYFDTGNLDYSGPEFTDQMDFKIHEVQKYFLFLGAIKNINDEKNKIFSYEVVRRSKLPPFNCNDCTAASRYSYYLHDAMLFYMHQLNEAMKMDPNAHLDGRKIMNCSHGVFEGLTDTITIGQNCTIDKLLYIFGFDLSLQKQRYIVMATNNSKTTIELEYTDASSTIWAIRGGSQPQNMPKCGFQGDLCQGLNTWWIIVIVAVVVAVLITVTTVVYLYRARQMEKERLKRLWEISFHSLMKPDTLKSIRESYHSLESSGTQKSGSIGTTLDVKVETTGYDVYIYDGDLVLAKAHNFFYQLKKADTELLKNMRQLEHENINTFIGLCLDAPSNALFLWKYNTRNSLNDVLLAKPPTSDAFFRFCIMRDIGLHAIHSTPFLKLHGRLTSQCCLINERWQVRISDYGAVYLGKSTELTHLDLLWTAPEHLRKKGTYSKAGDIYSFAIICSEILTEQTAWNGISNEEEAEELIYNIRRGRSPLTRPDIKIDVEDFNPIILQLIRECWSEHEDDRPSIQNVKAIFHDLKLSKNRNLMDHMLNVLEDYAVNLEKEIEDRTNEAIEEKKRADLLLYRILPKQVAEKLKLGQFVEPESYDEVSIFFSDIVSFTVLASKCSPMQVVTLLNDLYTMFDSIIDEHDVYKVETVGDAYLCASGVPKRNGHEHGREIANMALSVVRRIKNFRVPHLPNEVVNVRIGMHTGPVVAGVVGLTMPRYCLFGDSVNMATIMESHGKAGKIQLSVTANHLLTNVLTGFKTRPRGEIMVKEKGVLQTYWLATGDENDND